MAAMDQNLMLDKFFAESIVAQHDEFAHSKQDDCADEPSEKECDADDYCRLDDSFCGMVFFQTEKIEQSVDMDQEPSGHLV